MEYSLFFNLVSRIFLLIFVFLAIADNSTLNTFVFASVSATLVNNLLKVLFSKKLVKVSFDIDLSLIKQLLKESIPIAVASVFAVVYFKTDVLMLSFLRGDAEVGFYSAAYRLTDALVFLPSAFTTSTFPLMSKYFKDSFDSFSFAYTRTFKYLFAAGLLIAVLVTFDSEKIILTFYGSEYQKSVIALKILIWATAITFISVLVSSACVSSGNQQIISKTAILAAFLNVALNLILIPSNGYVGAAVATVLSALGSMLFGLFWIHKNLLQVNPFKGTISPFIGAIVISLLIILLRSYADILFLSAVSVPIFFSILYITGWIDSDDKAIFLNLFPTVHFNSKRF
jgi:O-antigen/teichoic acid export membrane protein